MPRIRFDKLRSGERFIHEGQTMIKFHNPEKWAGRDYDSPIQNGKKARGAQLNALRLDGTPFPVRPGARVIPITS